MEGVVNVTECADCCSHCVMHRYVSRCFCVCVLRMSLSLRCRYPHEKYTLGFAGRGGGNAIYINVENNTMVHGPGTDRGGKDPESDTCFGRLVPGTGGEEVVRSMRRQEGMQGPNGFVRGDHNFIKITQFKLLTPAMWREVVAAQFPEISVPSVIEGRLPLHNDMLPDYCASYLPTT